MAPTVGFENTTTLDRRGTSSIRDDLVNNHRELKFSAVVRR